MKHSTSRRFRRRAPAHEIVNANKENKQEQSFFGESFSEPFFKPVTNMSSAMAVNRKCADCEEEQVQRAVENKEEDEKKIMKKEEKEEEEQLQRAPKKKEEETVMKKEEKKEEEGIQKKDSASYPSKSTTAASNYIQSINGKGQSIDSGTRSFFESRMNSDFTDVKIHTGKDASASAQAINAQAYTFGNNIVFNEGKYSPGNSGGKHLLAHELTHVVQQSGETKNLNPKILQRKITYSKPSYKKKDPIPGSFATGGGKLGETFMTINGFKVTTDKEAIRAIFEVFNNNLSFVYNTKTKIGTVDTSKLAIDISAEIKIPTDPVNDKWSGKYPGSLVSGSPKCSKLSTVSIEMISTPSGGAALLKRVLLHEGEHYSDIKILAAKHLHAYHKYLDGLSFKVDTAADLAAKFKAEVGDKDIVMARKFIAEWLAAVQKYDNPKGTHHTKSEIDARNCNLVMVNVRF